LTSAIITGATGFIGSALVRELIRREIKVLALGRKTWFQIDRRRLNDSPYLTYLQLDMNAISDLPGEISLMNWQQTNDCVFFNFAWGGISKLSDLDVYAQMKNVVYSVNALMAASTLNCSRFIHVGTMEEAFAEHYLNLNHRVNKEYNRHVVYSIAKKVSREALKAYSNQLNIDLIIATNSHVMGPNDDKDSFLQVTLEKLINGEELAFSSGEQMFDVISLHDCVKAYIEIAQMGLTKNEYWIGSGKARKLREYVEIMYSLYPSKRELQFGKMPFNDISLGQSNFCIKKLLNDTSFKHDYTYEDTVHELYQWLINRRSV
jgi:nucleoside-diphosphate-sugar epimerase